MTAGPPVGLDTFSAATALTTGTPVPVLLHPGLIYVFRIVPTLGEPWELISQIQTTQPGRVVIGVSCQVFFQGHPSKYYEPFSALLNLKWKPGLQPPHHLSSPEQTTGPLRKIVVGGESSVVGAGSDSVSLAAGVLLWCDGLRMVDSENRRHHAFETPWGLIWQIRCTAGDIRMRRSQVQGFHSRWGGEFWLGWDSGLWWRCLWSIRWDKGAHAVKMVVHLADSSGEDEVEWNLGTLFKVTEPDELKGGRLKGYCA